MKAMMDGLHDNLKHLRELLVLLQNHALLLNPDRDRDQNQSLDLHPDRGRRLNPDRVQDQSRRPSHLPVQNRRLEADLQANRLQGAVLRVNLRHAPGLHLDLLQDLNRGLDQNLDQDLGRLLSLDQVLTVSKFTSKFVFDYY